eukprot:6531832-Pyramimonas_sp.AAC.1
MDACPLQVVHVLLVFLNATSQSGVAAAFDLTGRGGWGSSALPRPLLPRPPALTGAPSAGGAAAPAAPAQLLAAA